MHFKDLANKKRLIAFYDDKLVGWTGRHIDPLTNKQTNTYTTCNPGYVFNIDKFINSIENLWL